MLSNHACDFIRSLSIVLVEERLKQGISKNELAARANIDRAGLIRAERGDKNPTIGFYIDWCRGLGLKFSVAIQRAEKLHAGENEAS
ncbi:MAG: helix-turn-helix transcriptional regulator [Luteolibacter sp.]